MSPRSASAPSDATALLDDFDWPPTADNVSVHAIDVDPWQTDDADDAIDVIFEPDTPAPPSPPSFDRRRER
jgi:hypothetical protein